jgi:VWFA-related protein
MKHPIVTSLSFYLVLALVAGRSTAALAGTVLGSPTAAIALPALLVGPATAQDPESEPSDDKKPGKKRVRATLVEPEGRPDAATDAETAEDPDDAAESAPSGEDAAENDPSEADASAAETSRAATDDASAATTTEESSPTAVDRAGVAPRSPAPASTTAPSEPIVTDDAREDRPTFQERVEVIEVFLDAIVKDGKEHVLGLGPDDFKVEEEGREVEVTSVQFYGTPDQLSASGEGEVERADRYFILFFHDRARDAPLLRSLLLDAGQQARRWAEQELLPNDQVAVVMYDVRLKVYTDFTRDREQIVEAISRAVSAKKEPERAAGRSKEPLRPDAGSPSLLLNLPAGRDLMRETGRFEDALTLLGRAAEGIVGRKNLMLFSIGFGDTDSGGVWTPDPRFYPDIERSLNDGNVAVYAIDLVGSRRLGSGSPGIASSLSSLAADTAGLYLENFTTFITPMKQVAEDTRGYYLLSYRSEYDRGTSGYREVKVTMRDKRYDVHARQGYLYGEETPPLGAPDRGDEEGGETGDALPESRGGVGSAPGG